MTGLARRVTARAETVVQRESARNGLSRENVLGGCGQALSVSHGEVMH